MRKVITFALLFMSSMALAQVNPTVDGIGIYADLEGTQLEISASPGEMFPVYLLFTNPSMDEGYFAWGARIVAPDNADIVAWNVQGSSFVNWASPPEFCVCYAEPVPTQMVDHLMTFIVRMTDATPGYFYVEGAESAGQAFTDHPFLILESNLDVPHWLQNIHGDAGQPVFAVNGTITPVEAMSWSGVKALF